MTLKTIQFVYTLSGKNPPYTVNQFDLNGVYLKIAGTIDKADSAVLAKFIDEYERREYVASNTMAVSTVVKRKRGRPKKQTT